MRTSTRSRTKTGTREWAACRFNWRVGCRHGCLYCYARAAAMRFGRIATGAAWQDERPTAFTTNMTADRRAVVMAPTTHDVGGDLEAAEYAYAHLARECRRVLCVTKDPTAAILTAASAFRHVGTAEATLEVRVSVTAMSSEVSAFWEPAAPPPRARLTGLRHLVSEGIAASASMEPMLEPERAVELFGRIAAILPPSSTIWLGPLNGARARTAWFRRERPELAARLDDELLRIEAVGTDARLLEIFHAVKEDPRARFKDAFASVLRRHGHRIEGGKETG